METILDSCFVMQKVLARFRAKKVIFREKNAKKNDKNDFNWAKMQNNQFYWMDGYLQCLLQESRPRPGPSWWKI